MLSPEQVIPFLRHDDEMVRQHAERYLAQAHDVGPLTADEIWATAESLGLEDRGLSVLRLLDRVPQDDASTEKLLALLGHLSDLDDPVVDDALILIEEIDFEQLRRHKDRIYASSGVDDELREILDERLLLAEESVPLLIARLRGTSLALGHSEGEGTAWQGGERVVEALARHGAAAAEAALALLDDPKERADYTGLFAIDALAAVRHRPALDRLMELFAAADEEDDALHERIMYALPKVGGTDAVAAIDRAWGDQGATWQLYAAGALERIKHPDAEAALLRLIETPMERHVKDGVSGALAALCTTDGLPVLRELVLNGDYDPAMIDLKQDLVVCAMMAGYQFPEFATLREEVVAREVERERRLEALMNDPNLLAKAEGAADLDELLYGEEYDDLPPQLDDRAPRVVAPIHRDEAKVGRNDPCPCGSGKKYKKCCLGKA